MPERSDQKTIALEEQPAVSANPLASDPELLNDFIVESKEHLTSIELQLLTLDQDPGNGEAIHAIFRGFHTIKGMAGFLDLDQIREVAHEVETILDLARNGALQISAAVIDRILESKDYLNRCLTDLETMLATGLAPAAPDNTALIEGIRNLGNAPPKTRERFQARLPVQRRLSKMLRRNLDRRRRPRRPGSRIWRAKWRPSSRR